jgi:8-oxo-dGTP pyrophosphatase MutT (NUDIX family)
MQTSGKRIAAVLIPIVLQENHLSVLLTKRAEHLQDHAGQISFPGGRKEESDQTLQHTALREAHEEIGLAHHHVEPLGHLPDYFTVTGYQVTPIVGLVSSVEELVPDTNEVAEIFQVPLAFLMDPANHQIREWEGPNGRRRFYAMPYESKFIWGATAGMLRNLYHFLRA